MAIELIALLAQLIFPVAPFVRVDFGGVGAARAFFNFVQLVEFGLSLRQQLALEPLQKLVGRGR